MVTIEEKVALMKELGMSGAVNRIEREAGDKKAIEEMTGLKFKPITVGELEDRLVKPYRRKAMWARIGKASYSLLGVATIVGCAYIGPNWTLANDGGKIMIMGAGLITIVILSFINIFANLIEIGPDMREIALRSRDLSDWNDPISQGALLAVKEAKSKGLSSFEVYYPVKDVMLNDPIIVGYKRGVRFEVAYWDDGILREENDGNRVS